MVERTNSNQSCKNCSSVDYEILLVPNKRIQYFCGSSSKQNKYSGQDVETNFVCKYWKNKRSV